MGLSSTRETRGRKLTKTIRGYEGTRYFKGPRSTIVSDLEGATYSCSIGDTWPSDSVVDNIWTSLPIVQSIDLTYELGQKDAEAIVKYATDTSGGSAGKQPGDVQESFDSSAEELFVGGIEGVDELVAQAKDQDDDDILNPVASKFAPTAKYIRTQYYSNSGHPSASDLYDVVGKVNSQTWKNADPDFWLCTATRMNQVEDDLWEVTYEFQYTPNHPSSWNRLVLKWGAAGNDADSDTHTMYGGYDFNNL